jgi:DNA polymerase elongation subunit (family B)
VVASDPDILVSTEQHYRSTSVLQYLFARIEELGIDIELGRGKMKNWDKRNSVEGRVYLDSNSVGSIVGLIEKARFACLPLGLAARYRYLLLQL